MFVYALVAALQAASAVVPVNAVPSTPPAEPRKVCRSVVGTGSVLAKRECHTAEEWAARSPNPGAAGANQLGNGYQMRGASPR